MEVGRVLPETWEAGRAETVGFRYCLAGIPFALIKCLLEDAFRAGESMAGFD